MSTGQPKRYMRRSPTVDRRQALATADAKMAMAKARFSLAVLAVMRRSTDAEAQVQAALKEVDRARAALREVTEDLQQVGAA